MNKRVLVLMILLLVRCVLGWIFSMKFAVDRPVIVVGDIVKVYWNNSDCIMMMDKILINSGKICAAKVGDKVRVVGTFVRRVIDSFAGKIWLVSRQIDKLERTQKLKESRTQDEVWMSYFRESLVLKYKKFMPEPEAGLTAGVVLGYKKDIGQEFYNQMVRSGSIHIAVASGYNILLVGGMVLSLCFWFVKRSKAVWIALIAMVFYAVLAGGDPPVMRAVWMASFMYLSQVLGRKSLSYWILLLTAWVMLMLDPSLMTSASFQLSVAASFGLMIIEPWLSQKLESYWGNSLVSLGGNIGLTTSVSTMAMTLPIIWWHFGRMSLLGIVSNILILPLVPPLMMLGVGVLVLPMIFSWPTYALAHWVVLIIKFFGN